jgi:DNA/RNA-binding domain of Phe-tRNA-synthetase-like protein
MTHRYWAALGSNDRWWQIDVGKGSNHDVGNDATGCQGLAVALVEAIDVQVGPADEALCELCASAATRVAAEGSEGGDARRTAVRDLLRYGGYKPSGRSKPAQEYLLRTVREEGGLPTISNAVDLINAVSLQSGLPISLISLDRAGDLLLVRYGQPGESYVFNRSGQELDVKGLLCLCAVEANGSRPVGSPVKDSMLGKIDQTDRRVLACIFAPQSHVTSDELLDWGRQLADGFTRFCRATHASAVVQPETWDNGAGSG